MGVWGAVLGATDSWRLAISQWYELITACLGWYVRLFLLLSIVDGKALAGHIRKGARLPNPALATSGALRLMDGCREVTPNDRPV